MLFWKNSTSKAEFENIHLTVSYQVWVVEMILFNSQWDEQLKGMRKRKIRFQTKLKRQKIKKNRKQRPPPTPPQRIQPRHMVKGREQGQDSCSYIRVKHLLFKSSKKVPFTAFCGWQWPIRQALAWSCLPPPPFHVRPWHAQRTSRAGHPAHTPRSPENTTSQAVIRTLIPETHWSLPQLCQMKSAEVSPPLF